MSDVIVSAKIGGLAQKNTALQSAFQVTGTRCFLLKREGQTKRYTQLVELTSGVYVKFDSNRAESGLFRYATTSFASFRDTWAHAHAVAYGVPITGTLEIYEFPDGEKDRIDPNASSVYFAGRMVRVPEQRHTIV